MIAVRQTSQNGRSARLKDEGASALDLIISSRTSTSRKRETRPGYSGGVLVTEYLERYGLDDVGKKPRYSET